MVGFNNFIIGIINTITLVLSLPALGAGLWFRLNPANQCEQFLSLPLLCLGGFLFVVSIFGLLGACGGVRPLLWLYLFVLFFLIISVFTFTVFSYVVLSKGAGHAAAGVGFKEYKLSAYSDLMQKMVADWETWEDVSGCLKDAMVCRGRDKGGFAGFVDDRDAEEFLKEDLSPLEAGCCKPPTSCGFEFRNATFWVAPEAGPEPMDEDCKLWSNEQDKLCYACGACKAGVLATMKSKWKEVLVFNVSLLVVIIVLYSLGCCTVRSKKSGKKYYGGGP